MPAPVTLQEVLAVIRALLPPGTSVGPDTPLLSSGLVDSFAVAELLAGLEARFGVALPLDAIGSDVADTAADLTGLLASAR